MANNILKAGIHFSACAISVKASAIIMMPAGPHAVKDAIIEKEGVLLYSLRALRHAESITSYKMLVHMTTNILFRYLSFYSFVKSHNSWCAH